MTITLEELARLYGELRGEGTLKSCIAACIGAGYARKICESYCKCLKASKNSNICERHLRSARHKA